jgi:hypothetical protein
LTGIRESNRRAKPLLSDTGVFEIGNDLKPYAFSGLRCSPTARGANVAVEPTTWGPTISEFPMPLWLAMASHTGFTCLEVLLQWEVGKDSRNFFPAVE